MAHQTFKVCILIDNMVENFYIKHYIDEYQPVFNRFKNQVFTRNPSVNTPTIKIYWIDSENDEILIACEEDFRLFLEQGQGRKIFFCANSKQQKLDEGTEEAVAMEAEEIQQKCDRRSRKARDEEKQRRHARKLADKLKHLEEKCIKDDDKGRRFSEKREYKHAERMEKAKRRVEQIRSIIGSIDPANLSSSNNDAEINVGASTSASTSTAAPADSSPNAVIHPSPETIRLLSSAIAGCLQPCNLINKILNEVIGMIPQMNDSQAPQFPPPPYTQTNEEQQQQEASKLLNSQATNTSDANTPVAVRQASHEIEALFKEAAKELEKMNEIVNSSKSTMETSQTSSSGFTGITQVERTFANINDSAISNATVINSEQEIEDYQEEDEDQTDGQAAKVDNSLVISMFEDDQQPLKSMRSRESSIEVHDVNSMMSDDSRDCWTIVDQEDDEEVEMKEEKDKPETSSSTIASRMENPSTGAIPKKLSVDNSSQVEKDLAAAAAVASIETQTPTSLLSDMSQQELQKSVQKSIDIVQKSIQTIQKTMENAKATPIEVAASMPTPEISQQQPGPAIPKVSEALPKPNAPPYGFLYEQLQQMKKAQDQSKAPAQSVESFLKAQQDKKTISVKFEPAVVVYDPNPKINAAVHTMMNMGFSNEDNWLTQVLVSCDGDIPKALNFLTPQPKPMQKK